eukprot:8433292-Alexandrium_andersonii.AAC.1
MSASLVGSEMCIRDRRRWCRALTGPRDRQVRWALCHGAQGRELYSAGPGCLLYTSDAADDM